MRPEVLIVGHGEMGHALEALLAGHAHLAIWTRRPADPACAVSLEAAAARADFVLLCLPTLPHAEILARLAPALRPQSIVLSVAKGLDDTDRPVSRILDDCLGTRGGFGVLHGPMIAEEIQAGRHAWAQLGSRGADVAARVRALFAGTRLHVTPTPDMLGINWAVILKNVYAIAFGFADGLQLGDNLRGWLAVTALHELDVIVQRLGGQPGTPYGLAGLGDLITTATSAHSHHHEVGLRLARGATDGIDGEGVRTLARVAAGRLFDPAPYPLFGWVGALVRDPADPQAHAARLLALAG